MGKSVRGHFFLNIFSPWLARAAGPAPMAVQGQLYQGEG